MQRRGIFGALLALFAGSAGADYFSAALGLRRVRAQGRCGTTSSGVSFYDCRGTDLYSAGGIVGEISPRGDDTTVYESRTAY
jgi:hypothetical protein